MDEGESEEEREREREKAKRDGSREQAGESRLQLIVPLLCSCKCWILSGNRETALRACRRSDQQTRQ